MPSQPLTANTKDGGATAVTAYSSADEPPSREAMQESAITTLHARGADSSVALPIEPLQDELYQDELYQPVKFTAQLGENEVSSSSSEKPSSSVTSHAYQCIKRALHTAVPPGGHVSNIFNKASGSLGIGIVSMASGFNSTGVVLSAILMIVCGLLIMYSFFLLGMTCQRSGVHSWEEAARKILFRNGDYVISVVLALYSLGNLIGYVISVHDLLGPFVDDDSVSPFLRSSNGRRILTAIVWFCGMLSLSLPRRIASLRYVSIVGVAFIVFFTIVIVYKSCAHGLPHLHEMHLFSTGLDAVNGLTLFIFAFMGHGLCFRLYHEMPKPSAVNLAIAGAGSVSLLTIFYYLVGFFGYADIGLALSGSIFKYYSVRDDVLMMVVYIGIVLKVCVAYALTGQIGRLSIYYLLRKDLDTAPLWQHLVITISICLVSFILGIFIPDITIVFNLIGSICGGILAFLLPAYFVMYIGGWTVAKVGWFHVIMTYLNIVAGVVSLVFGTVTAIYKIVQKYR